MIFISKLHICAIKALLRYTSSVVRGSFLITVLWLPKMIVENIIYLASLCGGTSPGCTDCLLRSCFCLSCHQKWLIYFSKYSYIFLALFGYESYEAARMSFYLINRNKDRIFVPANVGDFGMIIIKLTIPCQDCPASALVILSSNTLIGQATISCCLLYRVHML